MHHDVVKIRIQSDWGYDNSSLKNPYIDLPNKKYKSFQKFEFRYVYLNANKVLLERILGNDAKPTSNEGKLLEDF